MSATAARSRILKWRRWASALGIVAVALVVPAAGPAVAGALDWTFKRSLRWHVAAVGALLAAAFWLAVSVHSENGSRAGDVFLVAIAAVGVVRVIDVVVTVRALWDQSTREGVP